MDALLLVLQYLLGSVAGVELITPVLLVFTLIFGMQRAWVLSMVFSLTRCFLFGFYPLVVLLYVIFYSLFVWLVSQSKTWPLWLLFLFLALWNLGTFLLPVNPLFQSVSRAYALVMTASLAAAGIYILIKKDTETIRWSMMASFMSVLFGLLDDLITPFFLSMNLQGFEAYFLASLPIILLQSLFSFCSTFFLYKTLKRVFQWLKSRF